MKALIMLYGHDSLFVFFKDALKNFEIKKKEPEDLSEVSLIIILTHCWRDGDPGIKFLDKINPKQIPTLIIDTQVMAKLRKEWEATGFIVSDISDLFSKTRELLEKQKYTQLKAKGA
ncbi:hypothetical protein L6252_02625 [Candidatus Parcubacteria bacterium]|nr:hypothetical protein [Candidatus Parcubacteria bacterium]